MDEVLRVEGLRVWYHVRRGLFKKPNYVKAVDGVSFRLSEGETLALVGESGCGKSTLGRATLGLVSPIAGRIYFNGVDISRFRTKEEIREFRRKTSIIFQDPFSSLNPAFNVYKILEEPLIVQGFKKRDERAERIYKALELVRLEPVEVFAQKYPHMLSGGQRQRVAIARAMLLDPQYIVADEPVSMLDTSVRVEILYLLRELQERLRISFLYITHDIATAKYFSDRIAVMYAGNIVELGSTREVLRRPLHPYTRVLMEALPDLEAGAKEITVVKGEPPNLINPPPGCRFHPRCNYAVERCREEQPLEELVEGHFVACHRAKELFL